MPDALIKRANDILEIYENKEKHRDNKIQESLPIEFVEDKKSKIEEELKNIDILKITPIEALNKLYEWKEKI